MKYTWEKRWSFSDALYCEDFIISKHTASPQGYHVEQVAPTGETLKHYGTYSNLQAAQYVAEAEMKKRGVK